MKAETRALIFAGILLTGTSLCVMVVREEPRAGEEEKPILALDSVEARVDAGACWERYLDLLGSYNLQLARADSLGGELITLRVRLAEMEGEE